MASRPDPQFLIQYLQNEGRSPTEVQKNSRLYDFLRQVWSRIREIESRLFALEEDTPAATVTPSAPGSWTEVEINFGSIPEYDYLFTITDAAITPTSKVVVVPSGNAPTGRPAGDWQWDGATLAALPGTGSASVYAVFLPGPIVGTRKFFYQVA